MKYYLCFYSVYSRSVRCRNLKKWHSLTTVSPTGSTNFSFLLKTQTGPGAQPASYSMGAEGSSLEVTRQGYEVDQSPPTSVEVKNEWSYTATIPTSLYGVDMGNFTFFFNFTLYGNLFFPMHASHIPPPHSIPFHKCLRKTVFCVLPQIEKKTVGGEVQLASFAPSIQWGTEITKLRKSC